jgi:hypothetical protein
MADAQRALLSLMRALASGKRAAVTKLLAATPALARETARWCHAAGG